MKLIGPGIQLQAVLVCLLFTSFACGVAYAAESKEPKAAELKISGYGILGNRELKRILTTLELGGKKQKVFGASFVEDAALILSARIKRDGFLEPEVTISLGLAEGGQL